MGFSYKKSVFTVILSGVFISFLWWSSTPTNGDEPPIRDRRNHAWRGYFQRNQYFTEDFTCPCPRCYSSSSGRLGITGLGGRHTLTELWAVETDAVGEHRICEQTSTKVDAFRAQHLVECV